MKTQSVVCLAVLLLALCGSGALAETLDPISVYLLAAMPTLERGMTQIAVSPTPKGFRLSVSRAIASHIAVRGVADTASPFDLRMRLFAPLELVPAFFAVEFGPRSVTGLMTLFFGPVAVDLGRTWFEPARWALVQWVVNPYLVMVVGGVQQSDDMTLQAGWRIFPSGSASWEVGMMFGQDGIKLSLGGVL